MRLTKQKSDYGLNIFLEEDGKYLGFVFGGNGDLYWTIRSDGDKSFVITKENYAVYKLFEELYADIENINVFDDLNYVPFYIDDEEEKRVYLEGKRKDIERQKTRYRLYDHGNYNELFDKKKKTITWYSDETVHEVANILKITKKKSCFKVEFFTQPYIKGYDQDFGTENYIPVRISNSGSSYDPFNVVFMRMYNKLIEVDDINDYGHQFHMEEYMYRHSRVKRRMN